jgi:hypothetical protein
MHMFSVLALIKRVKKLFLFMDKEEYLYCQQLIDFLSFLLPIFKKQLNNFINILALSS